MAFSDDQIYVVAPETLLVNEVDFGYGTAYTADGGKEQVVRLCLLAHTNGEPDQLVEFEMILSEAIVAFLRDRLSMIP